MELPSWVPLTGLPPTPADLCFPPTPTPSPPGAAASEREREAPQVGGGWVDRLGDRCQRGGRWEKILPSWVVGIDFVPSPHPGRKL